MSQLATRSARPPSSTTTASRSGRASTTGAHRRRASTSHLDRLRRFVDAGDRVLDVGAGRGASRSSSRGSAHEVAVCRPLAAAARAQPRARRGGGPRGTRRRARHGRRARPLRSDDGSFDATVCFGGPLSYVVDRADDGIAELVARDEAGRPRARHGDVARRHGRSHFLPLLLDLARRDGVRQERGDRPHRAAARRARLRAPGDEAVPLERARGAARAARDDRRRVAPPGCSRPSSRGAGAARIRRAGRARARRRAGRGLLRPAHPGRRSGRGA